MFGTLAYGVWIVTNVLNDKDPEMALKAKVKIKNS